MGKKKKTSESRHTKKLKNEANSLAVQWLGLCSSISGGTGLIPGQEMWDPPPTCHSTTKKKRGGVVESGHRETIPQHNKGHI